MHVMFGANTFDNTPAGRVFQLSAVAFELTGDVREPHELLQFEERSLDLHVADTSGLSTDIEAPWGEVGSNAADVRRSVFAKRSVGRTQAFEQLFDFCVRWTGKRGGVWPRRREDMHRVSQDLCMYVGRCPWKVDDVYDARTLVMLAQKVPAAHFRAPDMRQSGLRKLHALHECVTQAVIVQAAFRALVEHAGTRENALLRRLAD